MRRSDPGDRGGKDSKVKQLLFDGGNCSRCRKRTPSHLNMLGLDDMARLPQGRGGRNNRGCQKMRNLQKSAEFKKVTSTTLDTRTHQRRESGLGNHQEKEISKDKEGGVDGYKTRCKVELTI